MGITAEAVLRAEQLNIHAVLEQHHDVAAAEEEVSHRVALVQPGADLHGILPVARADLGHADRQHGHKAVFLCVEDDAVTRLDHLPAGVGVFQNIALMLRVPDRDPPCAVDCRDLADLQNRAAHRCVITVIIVDIQKRMGQRAAVERVGIGGVRTDQLRDRVEDQALDDSALLLHQTAVFVNVPDSLRFGIGRGNHVGKSDRPHGRRDEMA